MAVITLKPLRSTTASRPSPEPETRVGGQSGFLQDQFVDLKAPIIPISGFGSEVLRDRIMRPRQPEFQNGIDDLAGRNGGPTEKPYQRSSQREARHWQDPDPRRAYPP
jgi:hypothetical protein